MKGTVQRKMAIADVNPEALNTTADTYQIEYRFDSLEKALRGIDFDAVDEEPVYLVVLLLSPVEQTREHLVALESVSRLLQ